MATSPQVTYDTVGIKEDVSEVIGLISPFDTPCYSSWKKPACHNTIVQWQEDALRAPAANAAVEGSDVTIADYNPTVMKDNRTQLFEETAQVSSTVQATDRYGRGSEMDFRVMKKSREVRRDIEYAFVGANQDKAAGDASTARTLGGAQSLIDVVDDNSGTPRDFDESQVLAVHQALYEAGGEPNVLMVPPVHAISVANFAYSSGRARDFANDTTIMNVVDLYVSPFGSLSVVTNKWVRQGAAGACDVFLFEMGRWFIPSLQPMSSEPLAKTGHSEKRLISAELSLGHENASASGYITDLNNTVPAVA